MTRATWTTLEAGRHAPVYRRESRSVRNLVLTAALVAQCIGLLIAGAQ